MATQNSTAAAGVVAELRRALDAAERELDDGLLEDALEWVWDTSNIDASTAQNLEALRSQVERLAGDKLRRAEAGALSWASWKRHAEELAEAIRYQLEVNVDGSPFTAIRLTVEASVDDVKAATSSTGFQLATGLLIAGGVLVALAVAKHALRP